MYRCFRSRYLPILLMAGAGTMATVFTFCVLTTWAEEPDHNQLTGIWACQSPEKVPESQCIESDQPCNNAVKATDRKVGCSYSLAGYSCPHDPPCFPGGLRRAEVGFATQVETPGTCESQSYTSEPCTKCKFLVCLTGTGHPELEDCWENINGCPMVGWHEDACQPQQ